MPSTLYVFDKYRIEVSINFKKFFSSWNISFMNAGLFVYIPYTKELEHIGTLIVFRSIVYIRNEMRLKEMYYDVNIIFIRFH
jgi:hypothetical protein